MATYANPSNQVAALKELYDNPSDYLKDLVYAKNPFLALVEKNESPRGMSGKYLPVPLIYGTPQGRSATFATAQSNQTAPFIDSFFVYRVSNYQIATITNELLEATKDDAGAFIEESKLVMDTAIRNISNDLAHDLFGDGTGLRGTMSTIDGSNGSIQLADINTIVQFEVGMTLVSFDASFAQPSGGAVGYVVAVNRGNGQLVVSTSQGGSGATPSNWTTSFPNLAVSGDLTTGNSTTANLKVSGLSAWFPLAAPTSGNPFWNVDRSTDVTRLAGCRFDGRQESIEEALIDGAALVAREGGQPDMCFMNFQAYALLEKSLGSKVQYVSVKHEEADIAFAGITVNAPYGPIQIIPDRSCPSGIAYLLDMKTLKLRTLNKAPHLLTYGQEGLEALRVGNADALEYRWGYYGNLVCNAPGWNCVVQIQSN